eukprot:m.258129 g.258129  ORF g.258129 m.258129 type:complete len:68 (+) comp15963_c0_seq27:144-347(+)
MICSLQCGGQKFPHKRSCFNNHTPRIVLACAMILPTSGVFPIVVPFSYPCAWNSANAMVVLLKGGVT